MKQHKKMKKKKKEKQSMSLLPRLKFQAFPTQEMMRQVKKWLMSACCSIVSAMGENQYCQRAAMVALVHINFRLDTQEEEAETINIFPSPP